MILSLVLRWYAEILNSFNEECSWVTEFVSCVYEIALKFKHQKNEGKYINDYLVIIVKEETKIMWLINFVAVTICLSSFKGFWIILNTVVL